MSVKVMGQVWELALSPNELIILLAMADHADHEGKHVHPGLPLIAWKTGYEERQVRRIIRQLEKQKLLIVLKKSLGGRHTMTEYEIHTENGVKKSPFLRNPDILTPLYEKPGHIDPVIDINPDILTPLVPIENLLKDLPTGTIATSNPDIHARAGLEPSLNRTLKKDLKTPLSLASLASPQGEPASELLKASGSKAPKRQKTLMSVDPFQQEALRQSIIDQSFYDWFTKKGLTLSLEDQWERFVNKALANGYKYLDWRSAFMSWLTSDFQQGARASPRRKTRAEVMAEAEALLAGQEAQRATE